MSSVETWFGILAVAVTGKFLLGPAGQNHKRILLVSNGKLSRPFTWRLLDTLTPIPVNATTKIFGKLLWFPIFGATSWLLDKSTGHELGRKLIIPDYAFLALAFIFTGRLRDLPSSESVPIRGAHWSTDADALGRIDIDVHHSRMPRFIPLHLWLT